MSEHVPVVYFRPYVVSPVLMPSFLRIFFVALLALLSAAAQAQLSIEITGAGANRIPVAIAIFDGEAGLPQSVSEIIRADLDRSGLFKLVYAGERSMRESEGVDFDNWRDKGADALLVGSVLTAPGGRYEIRFRLYDVQKRVLIEPSWFSIAAPATRFAAHRIADFVYQKLLGEPGAFATRVAYVLKNGGRYELQIADADGMNPQTALASHEPIISPSWSPDGSRLAYVSFELKKPVVYVHSLASGQRHVVANFKGSNSAPAWSPDGKQLAVVLTKDGGSQMYLVNADGSGVRRLASSSGIDTEPAFSADGQHVYFTSDRGGSPQIYRTATSGGATQRVTFEGSYNVTPRISPDGKNMVFVSRTGGRFQVTIMDLATRQTQILTDSGKDESPSFAPNGRMILYASEVGGRGVLAAVSTDGRVKQRLSGLAGNVREPAWGPFLKF